MRKQFKNVQEMNLFMEDNKIGMHRFDMIKDINGRDVFVLTYGKKNTSKESIPFVYECNVCSVEETRYHEEDVSIASVIGKTIVVSVLALSIVTIVTLLS